MDNFNLVKITIWLYFIWILVEMIGKKIGCFKFFISLVLLLITGALVYFKHTNQYVFLVWLISLFCLVKSFSFKVSKEDIRTFFTVFKSKSLLFIIIIFFVSRFDMLIQSKILKIHHDCAILAYHSYKLYLNFEQTGYLNMLGGASGPISLFPSFWFCLNGFIMYLFGYNIYSAKILSILNGLCILLCLWYVSIRFIKSKSVAIVASFSYATFFPAIYYSNTIYNNLISSFFYLLSLIFFLHAEKKDEKWYLLLGIILGFSLYFYLSSVVLPLIILFLMFFYFFVGKEKNIKTLINKIVFLVLGYIFSALPFWVFSFKYYNFFMVRAHGVSVLSEYKKDFLGFFIKQFSAMIGGFYGAKFNGGGLHFLDISLFNSSFIYILFIIGFLVSLLSFRHKEKFIFSMIFIFNFVLGGLLTESPPASHRLLPFFWCACFFVGLSVNIICDFIDNIFKKIGIKQNKNYYILIFISIILYLNIQTYNKGLELAKKLKDPVWDFISIYEKQKLPVYGIVPPHVPYLLSLYLGDFNFKIDNLNNNGLILNNHDEHFILLKTEKQNAFEDIKKIKNINGTYQKVLETKNASYLAYKLVKN